MERNDQWIDSLLAEKSFTAVCQAALKANGTEFLIRKALIWFLLLSSFPACGIGIAIAGSQSPDVSQLNDDLAQIGIGLSASILGFLIAGFSIFFALASLELLVKLGKMKHRLPTGESAEYSELKFIMMNFMLTFGSFLFLLSISVIVKSVFGSESPFPRWIFDIFISNHFPQLSDFETETLYISSTAGLFVSGFLFTLLFESILRLKTFIWNVYQSTIVAIGHEHLHQQD